MDDPFRGDYEALKADRERLIAENDDLIRKSKFRVINYFGVIMVAIPVGMMLAMLFLSYLIEPPNYSNPRRIPDCVVCARGCRTEADETCAKFRDLIKHGVIQ